MAHFLQQGVLLEPGPQHREVVDLEGCANMKALHAGLRWLLFEVIDDLAFPGSRPGDQQEDVKQAIFFHLLFEGACAGWRMPASHIYFG